MIDYTAEPRRAPTGICKDFIPGYTLMFCTYNTRFLVYLTRFSYYCTSLWSFTLPVLFSLRQNFSSAVYLKSTYYLFSDCLSTKLTFLALFSLFNHFVLLLISPFSFLLLKTSPHVVPTISMPLLPSNANTV